jgi:hypothetical protein
MKKLVGRIWNPIFANTLTALVPEVWAQEALMVLEANAVGIHFVHRDFKNEIAQFGDTVNAHYPGSRNMKRKWHSNDLIADDVAATNVPVVLNQHLYDSFIIKDGEESLAFKDLRAMYLVPSIQALNQGIDIMILSQVYHFMTNAVGSLGTDLSKSDAIAVETMFNSLNVPPGQRYGLLTPQAKGQLSAVSDFTNAEKIGDNGTNVREGSLGKLFGTNWLLAQNAPTIAATNAVLTTLLVNNASDYAAGSTSIVMDAFTTDLDAYVGGWCTFAGDMTPQKLLSATDGTETIVISPGLRRPILDNAQATFYKVGAVDEVHAEDRVLPWSYDGFSAGEGPQVGQLVSLADQTTPEAWNIGSYAALAGPTITAMLSDVPVQNARIDNDLVGVGPAGNYSLCLHPDAIAFVNRPLAAPLPGAGALSYVANYNNLSIRVVITYDGKAQGHRVTVDMLAGIKVLNTSLGIPLLS